MQQGALQPCRTFSREHALVPLARSDQSEPAFLSPVPSRNEGTGLTSEAGLIRGGQRAGSLGSVTLERRATSLGGRFGGGVGEHELVSLFPGATLAARGVAPLLPIAELNRFSGSHRGSPPLVLCGGRRVHSD